MNQEKIGLFIAKQRKEVGLTQEQLGELLGITKNAVSKWERGILLYKWYRNYFSVNTIVHTSFYFKIRVLVKKQNVCVYKKLNLYIHFASAKYVAVHKKVLEIIYLQRF